RVWLRTRAARNYRLILPSRGPPAGHVPCRFFRDWRSLSTVCLNVGFICTQGGTIPMTDLRLDGPVNILVLLGLTLPEVSEGDLAKIRAAAPPGSTIRVVPNVRDAIAAASEVEVILGFIPEALFHAAPRLRWVHAIASGVDMFLYPAMRDSHVVLTGEKG